MRRRDRAAERRSVLLVICCGRRGRGIGRCGPVLEIWMSATRCTHRRCLWQRRTLHVGRRPWSARSTQAPAGLRIAVSPRVCIGRRIFMTSYGTGGCLVRRGKRITPAGGADGRCWSRTVRRGRGVVYRTGTWRPEVRGERLKRRRSRSAGILLLLLVRLR